MTTHHDMGQGETRQSRSAALRANLSAIAPVETRYRSAKFRRALSGETAPAIRFADIAILPQWLSLSDDARNQLAISVAILHHKCAIDMELSGARLAAIAETIGDALFDHLCDAAGNISAIAQDGPTRLPRPEDFQQVGMTMMLEGLPAALSHRYPQARGNLYAANLTQVAAKICTNSLNETPLS